MRPGPWNVNLQKRQSTQQPPKIEKTPVKASKTRQKSPKVPNGPGWYNEWERHGMAAKGIKTGKKTTSGLGNVTANKHKLADSIQNDMHKSDKLLRKACKVRTIEQAQSLIDEAEKYYNKMVDKIQAHKQKYGELPYWVAYTWHGNPENWTEHGTVKKAMRNLKSSDESNFKKNQRTLFNAIKLGNEVSQ